MDKSQVKKSILIVVLAIILYGLLWISLVGIATLIFNTISHNKTNWFLNSNLFVIAAVLWLIIAGAFGYNYFVKARGLKKNGMLSPSEFKRKELKQFNFGNKFKNIKLPYRYKLHNKQRQDESLIAYVRNSIHHPSSNRINFNDFENLFILKIAISQIIHIVNSFK